MRCFIDSNVWLYAFIEGQDRAKTRRASTLIRANEPVVSTQVVNETCVNLLRRAAFTENEVRGVVTSFYERYPVYPLTQATLLEASELRGRYAFSFWDSVLVATALQTDVTTLFSEDMQDGLMVKERLEITNPFT